MINWKKEPDGSKPDWILTNDNDNEIIASITVLENKDGTYSVDAECKKLEYACSFKKVSKNKLKVVVPSFKKDVLYKIVRYEKVLSCCYSSTVCKKIYSMIDGIPVWKHLKNGSTENIIQLRAIDYGKFAEILGKRLLNSRLERFKIISSIFPGTNIVDTHFISRRKKRVKLSSPGDKVIEVNYKKIDDTYGKKIVIFEIKHGKIVIEQNQLRNYCSMIVNPEEHFKKADEVKIVYMMFDEIDTMKACASYCTNELNKEFAKTVLERIPVEKISEVYEVIEEGLPGLIE